MSIKLGDTAPDFTADSSLGEIGFYDFLGDSWGILFSHPADFTPVCTTELGFTSKLTNEFKKIYLKPYFLKKPNTKHEKILSMLRTAAALVLFSLIP